MRDPRFVAAHRGGPLDRESHAFLARWAADCAETALPYFTRSSQNDAPRQALEIGRAWAAGKVKTGVAQKASLTCHAAAREVKEPSSIAAARAAGQAVATAHFADHSLGALLYLLKALKLGGQPIAEEFHRRIALLPPHLRPPVQAGINARLKGFGLGELLT
jgi:hypothetical protein